MMGVAYVSADRSSAKVRETQKLFVYQNINALEVFYCVVITLGKVAIALQYRRIFAPSRHGFAFWLIQSLIWSTVIVYLAFTIWTINFCSPRERIWNPTIPGKCSNVRANMTASGSWNVFSDFAILVVPLYTIWHMNLPVNRKIGVSAVFATEIL